MEIFVLFVFVVFIFLVIQSVKHNASHPKKSNSQYHHTYSDSSSTFDHGCRDGWDMGNGGNDCGSSFDGGGGSDGGGGGGGD